MQSWTESLHWRCSWETLKKHSTRGRFNISQQTGRTLMVGSPDKVHRHLQQIGHHSTKMLCGSSLHHLWRRCYFYSFITQKRLMLRGRAQPGQNHTVNQVSEAIKTGHLQSCSRLLSWRSCPHLYVNRHTVLGCSSALGWVRTSSSNK